MKRALLRAAMLLTACAIARPALAQRAEGPSPLKGDSATRTSPLERRVIESIVFEAEPRSFQIVRVPVPALVRGADEVSYEIEPAAQFSVIGGRRGTLSGTAPDLLVTVRIPADARAGAHMAAHAVFRTVRLEVDVPIETRVRPIYRIRLNVDPVINGVQLGDRFELTAAIANAGNAVDTIHVAMETPMQWKSQVRDTVLIVAPGETAHRLARLAVPKNSSTGSFFIRTTAVSRGGPNSSVTTVAVGSRAADMAPPGPTVRMALGAVGVETGGSVGIAQLAVSGPLTNSIQIDTRIATQPATNASATRGLARVGAYVTEPHLTAWTSTWRLGLGSTVASFSDIMGVNAGGRGVAFDLSDTKKELHVTAAKPVASGFGNDDGGIFGAEFGRRIGATVVGAAVSRLQANGFGEQTLTAAGLEARSSLRRNLELEGGLAYRDYGLGTGMGWIAGVSGELPRTRGQLRIVHAPGGTDAFARAANEVVANVLTRWTDRVEVSTSFFRTSDVDAAHNDVRSRVVAIGPSYRLSEHSVMRMEVRSSNFEVDGDPFSFSNGELHFGIGGATLFNGITYGADAGIDRLTRGVRTDDVDAEDVGARFVGRATATRPFASGILQAEGIYERNDRSTGFIPQQIALTVRAERTQFTQLSRDLTLDAEIGYSRWTNIRQFLTFRAGANYMLPMGTEISASIERNPLMVSVGSKAPVVFALRVEKSFGLPRMNVGRAAGVVFQDYNGNGRRDADEPGMPNVRVRRGDVHATTDTEGRYRFWEEGRGATIVDPTTLPYGWVVNDRAQGENIAIIPTTRVEVQLQLGTAERMRNIDISQLVVTARDDSGRVWIARRTAREVAVFEALPAGSYELGIDATALAEPLRIDGTAPRITVTRETVTRVTLPVAGRPLRFKQQDKQ